MDEVGFLGYLLISRVHHSGSKSEFLSSSWHWNFFDFDLLPPNAAYVQRKWNRTVRFWSTFLWPVQSGLEYAWHHIRVTQLLPNSLTGRKWDTSTPIIHSTRCLKSWPCQTPIIELSWFRSPVRQNVINFINLWGSKTCPGKILETPEQAISDALLLLRWHYQVLIVSMPWGMLTPCWPGSGEVWTNSRNPKVSWVLWYPDLTVRRWPYDKTLLSSPGLLFSFLAQRKLLAKFD
jgi:hypothetical protein